MWPWPYLGFESNFESKSNQSNFFYMPYFGRQGQFENQATRQLSGLPLHQGYGGHSKPPGEVQAKPYEAIKNAASRHFLGIPLFKVSEWIFSWNWNLRLHLKTIHPKYQIFDAFREKCLSLSKKFHLVFSMKYSWKKNLEDLFMGVHTVQIVLKHGTTENTQIWCFNLHLILDVPQHFCQKLHVWSLITPVM